MCHRPAARKPSHLLLRGRNVGGGEGRVRRWGSRTHL
jgi:hypothetical protein